MKDVSPSPAEASSSLMKGLSEYSLDALSERVKILLQIMRPVPKPAPRSSCYESINAATGCESRGGIVYKNILKSRGLKGS